MATIDWGFNFRSTAGYVTDGPNERYVLNSDAYPVSRGGATFGYTATPFDSVNRSTSVDRRLAGRVNLSIDATATDYIQGVFRVNLPAGIYSLSLAVGDLSGSIPPLGDVIIRDQGGGVIYQVAVSHPTGNFSDAAGSVHTPANWPTNHQTVVIETSGNYIEVTAQNPVGSDYRVPLAHVRFIGDPFDIGSLRLPLRTRSRLSLRL